MREALWYANGITGAGAYAIAFSPSLDGTQIVLSIAGTNEDAGLTGDLDVDLQAGVTLTILGHSSLGTTIDAAGIDRCLTSGVTVRSL